MYLRLPSNALKLFEEANFKFVDKSVSGLSLCCPELPPTILYNVIIKDEEDLEKLFKFLDLESEKGQLDFLFEVSPYVLGRMRSLYDNLSDLKDDIELLKSGQGEELLNVTLSDRFEIGNQSYRISINSIKFSSLSTAIRSSLLEIVVDRQKKLIEKKQRELSEMEEYLNHE